MTLTRLRRRVSSLFYSAARPLASLPADLLTVLGLVGAAVFVAAARWGPLPAAVALAVSGLLDALDGAVARLRGEAGPRGAFLDSSLDRVADSLYAIGFLVLGFPVYAVVLFLAASLITSYTRARYESLTGRSMEGVGLLERADRLVAQVAVLLIDYAAGAWPAHLAYWVLAGLAWATAAQRIAAGYSSLPRRA